MNVKDVLMKQKYELEKAMDKKTLANRDAMQQLSKIVDSNPFSWSSWFSDFCVFSLWLSDRKNCVRFIMKSVREVMEKGTFIELPFQCPTGLISGPSLRDLMGFTVSSYPYIIWACFQDLNQWNFPVWRNLHNINILFFVFIAEE